MNTKLSQFLSEGLISDVQFIDKDLIPTQMINFIQEAIHSGILTQYVNAINNEHIENREKVLKELEDELYEELQTEMSFIMERHGDRAATADILIKNRIDLLNEYEDTIKGKELVLQEREKSVKAQFNTISSQLATQFDRMARKLAINEGREDELNITTNECPECGTMFDMTHPNKVYCSAKCSKKASNRRWRERSS